MKNNKSFPLVKPSYRVKYCTLVTLINLQLNKIIIKLLIIIINKIILLIIKLLIKLFCSVPFIHFKLMKFKVIRSLVLLLSTSCQQLLGKFYIVRCQNGVMVSDYFVFRKIKRCIDNMPSLC